MHNFSLNTTIVTFLNSLESSKAKILNQSFEVFSNNLTQNYTSDISVSNSILVVGENKLAQDFIDSQKNKYDIMQVAYIESFSGNLGNFSVKTPSTLLFQSNKDFSHNATDSTLETQLETQIEESNNFNTKSKQSRQIESNINASSQTIKNKDLQIKVAQIVFFSKFEILKPQLGIHFANDFNSQESLINEIDSLIGDFSFEKTILYDENKCQYFHRDKNELSYCHLCANICPNMSISKDDGIRELKFSDLDCITCGLCVNVCPSGAMQKANASLINFTKALKLYKNKPILILSQNFIDEIPHKLAESLVESINQSELFPLILPNINMLNEVYLLSILQESARECIILGEVENLLKESIDYVNSLYTTIFKKQVIYFRDLSNVKDAGTMLDSINSLILKEIAVGIPHYSYEVSSEEFSREIFSNRLKYFIKDSDFGILPNAKNILYTNLLIDSSKCTLCMSCVESCNAKALISSKDNFSLLLNPSLCTTCGICEDICPEAAISIPFSGFELKNSFLNYNVKAKDEPFACIECGKVFASTKSIQKVKSIMQPIFGNNEVKNKTLLCCSDCKVKVMFKG